jgi:dienelactone hydrolase
MCLTVLVLLFASVAANAQTLPDTQPLTMPGDLAAQMVAGIDKFLDREIEASVARRAERWQRDFSSPENYVKSVEPNRQRFLKIIGAADSREPVEVQLLATPAQPALVGEGAGYKIFAVRWNVFKGVDAEGLLLQPNKKPVADIVALPDCDATPEMLVGLTTGVPKSSQFARRLAASGCRVLVPTLIDRSDTYSGRPDVRMTNQPHREFIYRAAFELGRHVIGFEVQKILGAVDWFAQPPNHPTTQPPKVGVIGYGEGGLLAFYAAAADPRIDVAAVCGYFQPREQVWREPIYRNVFALLHEFGDAEIASLIAPRALIVEASRQPEISGPPAPRDGRSGAAPGVITTPPLSAVESEFARAQRLVAELKPSAKFTLVKTRNGNGLPGSDATLTAFLNALGVKRKISSRNTQHATRNTQDVSRSQRQFNQLVEHTQFLLREAEFRRAAFWSKADDSSVEKWAESCRWYRDYLWDEVIGRFPPATLPMNPRARLVYDEPKYRGYEVVLDVYPDVFAYGILLLPKDIKDGERRPVVVCQHGLEGRPQDVADPKVNNPSYNQYACRLAERGFITYAPQNPYIGQDNFRVLQRKLNPLKKSLFAVIVRQHERTLEWLALLPFVDLQRIAFYGLSYGGKTAVRVPAMLEQYCLSICSADYNEWIWKNASARHRYSYMFTGEYEMFEFDLGNTFNYAELSWLICPRPFMVERGHHDGVAPDEWVAYEFAKTRRRYDLLGIGDRTEMEVFNGPHTIHGVGTFEFLHRHLKWRKPDK